MFSLLVYSGKGGVGKTTVTYCLYKSLKAQGKRVAILDMDLNTPSFHHLASNDDVITASQNLGLFIDSAQISSFLKVAKKRIKKLAPDILLIDSPPSITHIHYALMEKLSLSGVALVTQPTKLSISDVEKTAPFFEQKGITVAGIIENMSSGEQFDYKYNKLASIPRADTLDSELVYDENKAVFDKLTSTLLDMDLAHVSLENRKRQIFDESINIDTVKELYGIKGDEDDGYYIWPKTARHKSSGHKNIKFVNNRTWPELREIIMDMDEGNYNGLNFGFAGFKDVLSEATPHRVARLLEAFENDEKALFMIAKHVTTTVPTLIGEIGTCTLSIQDKHYGIPHVEYHTAGGSLTLFPHEVIPVTQSIIDDCILDGYTYIEEGGRMIPPLELAQQLTNIEGGGDITARYHTIAKTQKEVE